MYTQKFTQMKKVFLITLALLVAAGNLIAQDTGSRDYIEVTVEIENDDWRGVTVNEQDNIEIRGEVDKDLMDFEIDVDTVTKK